MPRKQIHLAAHFPGVNNTTVWSDPAAGSHIEFSSFVHFARTAERAKFDFLFLAEGLRLREQNGLIYDLDVVGRPDTFTVLAALAAVTDRLGLTGTINSTFNEPYEVARQFATPRPPLRPAGPAGTSSPPGTRSPARTSAAAASCRRRSATRGPRSSSPRRASCSTPGAATRSSPTRSRARSSPTRTPAGSPCTSEQFDIAGRFTVPRSPQGRPVIFQAGDSEEGREFAAADADAIFTRHGTLEAGPGVLRRRQGPARPVRPRARRAARSCPRRRSCSATPTPRPTRRPTSSAASRSAAQTAIKFAGAAVEPRPVRPRPGRPAARRATRSSARTRSPRAGPACGCTATRWPPRTSGARWPRPRSCRIRELDHRGDRPADRSSARPAAVADAHRRVRAGRRQRRLHPRPAHHPGRARRVRRHGRAAAAGARRRSAPSTRARPCASTSASARDPLVPRAGNSLSPQSPR